MFFLSWLTNPLLVIALVALAIYTLRRTREPAGELSESDRRWRMLAVGVLGFFVLGFGVCGAFGTVAGLMSLLGQGGGSAGEARAYGTMFLIAGLLGLAVAGLGVWLLRRYQRRDA
jgi:uncharacterized membrane protein YfcA